MCSLGTERQDNRSADLFGNKSQLIVYHFMLGPGWEAGCPSCSYLADHFDGAVVHLAQRDVAFAVISRAPLAGSRKIPAAHGLEIQMGVVVRQRLQSRLPGLGVAAGESRRRGLLQLRADEISERRTARPQRVFQERRRRNLPHLFQLRRAASICWSAPTTFSIMAPKGRDEDGLNFSMAWVRHHDRYEAPWSIQKRHISNRNPPHAANSTGVNLVSQKHNRGGHHEALRLYRFPEHLEGAGACRLSEDCRSTMKSST